MNKYPIYVISKGRWESRLTAKALEAIGASWRIVIEPQEFDQYASVIDKEKILVLPFSNLGQGSIPARNWVWEHSISEGHERHWILDDNILRFHRLHQNKKYEMTSAICFSAVEQFADRYENVAMAGMQYELFALAKNKNPAVLFNTRVYSCILLANNLRHRWRGRYNEDTDLSLRVLKDGYCTVLTNAFLCKKMATMNMKGGNTEELYKLDGRVDGRLLMAQSLQQQHPDVTTITRKWGRWQHHVDYRPFKKNKLKLRAGVVIPQKPNELGMILKKVD
jgi:hypothetical protein